MRKPTATLNRKPSEEKQTLGDFSLCLDGVSTVFKCVTLELPWRGNRRNVSCIPPKVYPVVPRTSKKFGKHYLITGVPNRSYILFHPATFFYQLRGCIILGESYSDINKDGTLDILNTRKTLDRLLKLAPEGFELLIK